MIKQVHSSPVLPGGTAGSDSGSSAHDMGTWAAAATRDAAVGGPTATGGTDDTSAAAAACKQLHATDVREVHMTPIYNVSDMFALLSHQRQVLNRSVSPFQHLRTKQHLQCSSTPAIRCKPVKVSADAQWFQCNVVLNERT